MDRKYPLERPIAVDLFCGAGGFSLGLEQAGFEIALGIDRDGHHAATHERNFPYGKSLCASVVDLDGSDILKAVGTDRRIDLVVGGPPCQGFSHMGLRDKKDPRNSLIDHFVRLVLEIRPKAFVMENVPGLASGKTKSILESVVRAAEEGGYKVVAPVQVLDASDFGVPQKRKRLFAIGYLPGEVGEIEYPTEPLSGQPARPTVAQAIGDLPDVDRDERFFDSNDARYSKKPRSAYARVARGLRDDPTDLSIPRTWNDAVCSGCLRSNHATKSVRLYAATPPGETSPGHKLPRLHPEGIAPTLRAGSDSTHGSYTAPRPIHPSSPRCITAREAARLHGFPDWFSFYPLRWHSYRQIGNAVCPPMARAIGRQIADALDLRWTRKSPRRIELGDAFLLPKDRPKSLKRIPQIEQFPPVIEWLFERAFDAKKKKLIEASFSFADVRRAIAATGANMHWVRNDTFLAEIARNRRAKDLLGSVRERGYTIRESPERGKLGEFVPVGTAGSIEDKDSLQIRVDEIHNSRLLRMRALEINGSKADIEKLLSKPQVVERIWGSKRMKVVVNGADILTGSRSKSEGKRTYRYELLVRKTASSKANPAALVTCRAATLPPKDRLRRVARILACDQVVVLASATSKHFVAIRFENCSEAPAEVSRAAFEFSK